MLNSLIRSRAASRASGVLAAAALLATLTAGAAHADAMVLSVESVESSLREAGPRATLARHFSCANHQGTGYRAIARGSPQWVALAAKLMTHADACYAEGLQDALGQAMRRAPRAVLPLVGRSATLSAELICLPFISDEIAVSTQSIAVARSRRAIEAVSDEALRQQREACLQFIGRVEAGIASRQPAMPPVTASAPTRADEPALPDSRRAGKP